MVKKASAPAAPIPTHAPVEKVTKSDLMPFSDERHSLRMLQWALLASVLLHGVFLKIHFTGPESKLRNQVSLDVVLVNVKHHKAPEKAEVLAQHNVNAGGNVDRNVRAKTALPPQDHEAVGNDLITAQKQVQTLEERNRELLTRKKASVVANSQKTPSQTQEDPTPTPVSGTDIMNSVADIKRIEGELAEKTEEYAKRPRLTVIGSRAKEYRFAQYVEEWRAKVERVGTLNYPDSARGRLYGSLVVAVRIRADGSVVSAEITRSSGHKVLDDAALRTVKLAAPYQAFPASIRADTDHLEIIRTWTYTNEDKVLAQ